MAQLYLKGVYFDTDSEGLWYLDNSGSYQEISITSSYKVYTALLSQSGTSNPTPSILENTIGGIVWTRDSEGIYIGTLADAFTLGKTVCPPFSDPQELIGLFQSTPFDFGWNISPSFTADTVEIKFYQSSDGSNVEWSSLALQPLFIEIRVYS